jgi:hypothetical protein
MASLTPMDLLEKYWDANHTDNHEAQALQELARQVIQGIEDETGEE